VNFIIVVLLCFIYAIFNVSGAALIKWELQKVQLSGYWDYVLFLLRFKVIGGFAIVFLSALIMIKALSLSKISLVNSMSTGLNFTLTLLVGYIVFQDRLTTTHYFGIILILAGTMFIALAERA
jgi:multidrug transporter EmrE-like cation transporter